MVATKATPPITTTLRSKLFGFDQRASPEQIENIRRSYGLDQPLPVQYL